MIKVLIVDDEAAIRRLIEDYLIEAGFESYQAQDGQGAIEVLRHHRDIDLIILDVKMPKMDGFETISYIRDFSDIPVLFLTALSSPHQEVMGLTLGADDYIKKPFTYDVLMARINLALKKHGILQAYVFEQMVINKDVPEVKICNDSIKLRKTEWFLLIYLFRNANMTMSRQQIIDAVWGFDFDGDPRTLDTHIKTLRKKIGKYSACIKTVRGVGYCFEKTIS